MTNTPHTSAAPAQPPAPTIDTEADHDELAELDALANALNKLGFPSLRLTPPGKLPYVDTGLPKGMTPGERIYTQGGTFFWHSAEPIGPSDQPAAAAIIARALTSPATATTGRQG